MRRGTWILALSGAMALQAGGATAADPAATNGKSAPVPTRYNRPGTAGELPPSRNYYEELFGDAPGQMAPTKSPIAAPKTTATASKPDRRPTSAPPTKQIPLDDVTKSFPAEGTKSSVTHAGYDSTPGADKSFIQQVNASAERPSASSAAQAGDAAPAPHVTLEWVKRSDINVGQESHIELVVKNTGNAPATQVTVEASFPSSVRLTGVEPKPSQASDKLAWTFETIASHSEKHLSVKLVPSRRGDLGTSATVRYSGQAGNVFRVEEPLLKMAVKGPSEVLLGDPASQLITITNPGTGIAQEVKLEAILSDGLEHPKGQKLEIEVGAINPGDSQHVRLGISAVKGGHQTLQLVATSKSDATASTSWKINVIAPSLRIAVDGPGLRYKGRNAKYTLTVTNDGSVPNNNVRVTQALAEGFQFASADRGGKFDASQRSVHWFLGRLDAGQSQQVSCEVTATALGDFRHQVVVASDAGVRAEATAETRVEGTASLTTEIADLNDPVEVGVETAWEVRVRNEGSKAATNIAVACELPSGVELISAKGATDAVADNRSILFKSLKQLAPGQQAVFRVIVRGQVEGSHRLRARVTSDALDQPLMMEEATKFYADAKK